MLNCTPITQPWQLRLWLTDTLAQALRDQTLNHAELQNKLLTGWIPETDHPEARSLKELQAMAEGFCLAVTCLGGYNSQLCSAYQFEDGTIRLFNEMDVHHYDQPRQLCLVWVDTRVVYWMSPTSINFTDKE